MQSPDNKVDAYEFLAHYGIKGMRWGVRRRRSSDSSPATSSKKSAEHLQAQALRKKSISEMSNAELKALTTRMNLEKQYADLNKSTASAGQRFVADLLVNTARNVAAQQLQRFATQGLALALKSAGARG